RPRLERGSERALIAGAHALEGAVDALAEPSPFRRPNETRGHHRRERERDDARDEDRPREGEGELSEERAGEAALKTNRYVYRPDRHGHGQDGKSEFARALDRRVERLHPVAHVPLDVLHDHDRVIHDEAY